MPPQPLGGRMSREPTRRDALNQGLVVECNPSIWLASVYPHLLFPPVRMRQSTMHARLPKHFVRVCALLALAVWLYPGQTSTTFSSNWCSAGARALLCLENSRPVYDVLYRYGHVDAPPNGAYGPNVTAPRSAWFLEYQRAGGYDLFAGVLRHEPALISEGLRILHFGLARQASNGAFPGSAWPFHGTAMFLSEAAPGLLILQKSSRVSAHTGEIQWQVVRMRRAAYAMVRSVHGPGKIDDMTKTHRQFEAAIALAAVGLLSGDRTLVRWSELYAWRGVHLQRQDGVLPEDGGHDSGYQALGMVSAARYFQLIQPGALRDAVRQVLKRGEHWELTRIQLDGSINQNGDTRTVGCSERDPAGRCKTVFYAPVYSALAHWGAITGDPVYDRASRAVWLRSGYGGR